MNQKLDQIQREAEELLKRAEAAGVVLAIQRVSPKPFSMGKTTPVVHVWEKRS